METDSTQPLIPEFCSVEASNTDLAYTTDEVPQELASPTPVAPDASPQEVSDNPSKTPDNPQLNTG